MPASWERPCKVARTDRERGPISKLKHQADQLPAVTDSYLVELKDSVFRETPLAPETFDDRRIAFDSREAAEEWVAERNDEHATLGQLTLHAAHPEDTSGVDAYVVFRPPKGVWIPDESVSRGN